MAPRIPAGIFKPTQSRTESRSEATDRAARETIAREAADAAAKIDRLRAARLARDAALSAAAPPAKKLKAKAKA